MGSLVGLKQENEAAELETQVWFREGRPWISLSWEWPYGS